MSFNDVHPGDPMNAVNVQQVIDALKGTAGKGIPLVVDAVNDSTRYALTLQNDDTTNSRAINVLKSDGTVMIAADATGVTLGSPVNLQNNSVPGTAIQDASITNAKLGPSVARANLLTNGGFEIWQRGNGPFTGTGTGVWAADRWSAAVSGTDTLSVSRDSTNVDSAGSGAAAACTFTLSGGAGNTSFYQKVEDFLQPRGRTLSASVRVRTSTANAVRFALNDGALVYSSFHTGDGTWQTLTVSKVISSSTTALYLQIYFAASCTAYVDNAMLVVGSQPADYVPLHPADDLARCLRYYEIVGGANGDISLAGWAGSAGMALQWPITFRVWKAVTPTVTKNGTWAVGNANQPALSPVSSSGFSLTLTATAIGNTATANGVANGFVSAEANPLFVPMGFLMMQGAQPDYVVCGIALIAMWMMSMDADRTAHVARRFREFASLDGLVHKLWSPATTVRSVATRMFRSVLPRRDNTLVSERDIGQVAVPSIAVVAIATKRIATACAMWSEIINRFPLPALGARLHGGQR